MVVISWQTHSKLIPHYLSELSPCYYRYTQLYNEYLPVDSGGCM